MGAFEIPGYSISIPAGADLSNASSSGQWRFLKPGSTTFSVVQAGAGDRVIGVRQNTPKLGEAATVMVQGISYIEVGTGGIALWDLVASDANGKAVEAAGNAVVAGVCVGAGASGAVGAVLLFNGGESLAAPDATAIEAAISSKTEIAALTAVSTANGSDPATTQALANALKTAVNAIIAALKA